MRLGDLDALKEAIRKRLCISSLKYLTEQEKVIVEEIDNAPTVLTYSEEDMCNATSDGKPISTEGDLISRSELIKEMCVEFYTEHYYSSILNVIYKAPTVNVIQHKDWYLVNKAGAKELLDREKPQGGADIQKPNCATCDHFGKCEGCEKRDEE